MILPLSSKIATPVLVDDTSKKSWIDGRFWMDLVSRETFFRLIRNTSLYEKRDA